MNTPQFSRRNALQLAVGAAAATFLPLASPIKAFASDGPGREDRDLARSVANAYAFLDTMMDLYAQGSTLRLSQSYTDQEGLLTTAFTYDNAVEINARLARRRPEDIARAVVLGKTLLYAQQTDPAGDNRLRQGYFVDQPDANGVFLRLVFDPFFFLNSAVGDLAWAGIALAQLARATGDRSFLDGAIKLGQWIVTNTFSQNGAGGFIFGIGQTQKSTEHNIDAFALFTMLARLTGDASWTANAQHARTFVEAMWNPAGGFFWTGTDGGGITIFTGVIPEDVQTWSFLALLDPDFAASIDWVKTNLASTDTPQSIHSTLTGNVRIRGVSYSDFARRFTGPGSFSGNTPNVDPDAVWLEGTGHLAAALIARGRKPQDDIDGFFGDLATAAELLQDIGTAQRQVGAGQTGAGRPLPDGQGVVASSSAFLETGFGFGFHNHRHVGATGWFGIAALGANPFQLGLRNRDRD
ncbi:MAG TPA: hypothetical protein VGC88_12795 [Terriglobales bacterium]